MVALRGGLARRWTKDVHTLWDPLAPKAGHRNLAYPPRLNAGEPMVSRGVTIKITGRLEEAMAGLDERSGRLVELYLQGLTMAEIAAAVGEPEEVVRESVLGVVLRMRERLAA